MKIEIWGQIKTKCKNNFFKLNIYFQKSDLFGVKTCLTNRAVLLITLAGPSCVVSGLLIYLHLSVTNTYEPNSL